jgi:hypothetical protein
MSDLNLKERRKLEEFLEANDWFATHKELNYLFSKYDLAAYDLDPVLVDENVGTKRDRLRAFWDHWPNIVVSKLMLELIDLAYTLPIPLVPGTSEENEETPLISEIRVKNNDYDGYDFCKRMLLRLKARHSSDEEVQLSQTFFDNQQREILADLDGACLCIHACTYFFGQRELADKILEKYDQGVSVELILQDNEYNRKLQESHWNRLPSVLWWYPETDGINHHKMLIIDGQAVWHGSYNFTWSAENRNREEYTRDSNNEKVRQFAEEYVKIKKYIQQEQNVRSQIDIE